MQKTDFNDGLLGFLDASPTPFHATQNMSMMFENAGFIKLQENEKWSLEQGAFQTVCAANFAAVWPFGYSGSYTLNKNNAFCP